MSHRFNRNYLETLPPEDVAILNVVRAATSGFVQVNFILLAAHFERNPHFKIEAHIEYNKEKGCIEVYAIPTLNDPAIGEN